MGTLRPANHTWAAIAIAWSLLLSFVAVAAAQTPATSVRSGAGGWPKSYAAASGATVVLHKPQISDWTNQRSATLRAAVSYMPKRGGNPVLGTIVVDADTSVSMRDRTVHFSRLPGAPP